MAIMMSSNLKPASTLNVIVAFAIVYIVWGSTYFFIQMAMQGFPPLLLGAVRFLMSGLLMLCWGMAQKEKLFVWNNIKHAAVSGILLLFVGTGAVIWVEQYLASGVVAIMVSSSPIWFVVLDKPNWENNFSSKSTIAG
ncbi:MAG: EamA family transporter, partial [Ginsengibacter sp.]